MQIERMAMLLVLVPSLGCPGDKTGTTPDDTSATKDTSDTSNAVDSADTLVVDTATDADGDGVQAAEDCNDNDASVYPGADDTWYDGIDSDCDSANDYDADLDGHDSDAYGGDDCDDADPESRGAEMDDLALGIGPDCGTARVSAVLVGEQAGDAAGYYVSSGDINGDGYEDILVGAPSASRVGYASGVGYVVLAPIEGELSLADADATLLGSVAGANAGNLMGLGDNDGDFYDDINTTLYVGDERIVSVFHGPIVGNLAAEDGDGLINIGTRYSNGYPGGDVDGDALTDVLVSEAGRDGATSVVYLFPGPVYGSLAPTDASAALQGKEPDDSCYGSGAGDTDGDGLDDVLVECSGVERMFLFHGGYSGDVSFDDAETTLQLDPTDAFGAGDTDGDGTDDLIVANAGATSSGGAPNAGRVWILVGPFPLGRMYIDDASAVWESAVYNSYLSADTGAVDLNADGFDDIMLNTIDEDAYVGTTEVAHVILSPVSGWHDVSEADWSVTNSQRYYFENLHSSAVGDTNLDGFEDAVLGEAYRDIDPVADPYSSEGAAWLLLGGTF